MPVGYCTLHLTRHRSPALCRGLHNKDRSRIKEIPQQVREMWVFNPRTIREYRIPPLQGRIGRVLSNHSMKAFLLFAFAH